MSSLRRSRVRLAAVLLAPALVLAGCGGGDGKDSDAKPEAVLPTGNVEVPDGVTLTAAGTKFGFAQSAVVAYEPNTERSSVLSLTVDSVQTGQLADFAAFQLDDATKKSRPYYVRVRVENVGTGDLSRMGVPLYAVDQANSLIRPSSFSTPFPRCPSTPLPEGFGAGKTYQGCMVYFVPDAGTLEEMSYRPLQAFEPITWKGTVQPPVLTKAQKQAQKKAQQRAQQKAKKQAQKQAQKKAQP